MRLFPVVAALATIVSSSASASGIFLDVWQPSLNVEFSFGGSHTASSSLRFSGELLLASTPQQEHFVPRSQLPAYLRLEIDQVRGARALVAGIPLAGYSFTANEVEGSPEPVAEGGWLSNHWLMTSGIGAALVGAAVALGGGGGGDASTPGTSSPADPQANVCAVNGGDTGVPSACVPAGP
jgi:hypothetical protein